MEPVQRLIIGNNVYDTNDDELESWATEYLTSLRDKQRIAHEGKNAIIEATENKTGKPIITDTYAEITDKINSFETKTFEVNNLIIGEYTATYPYPHKQEFIKNTSVRFNDFNNWSTDILMAPFLARLDRDVIHKVPNLQTNCKLDFQFNITVGSGSGDTSPLFMLVEEGNNQFPWFSLLKIDNTHVIIKHENSSNIEHVVDITDLNYFHVEVSHIATQDKRYFVKLYGGRREVNLAENSGFSPESKVLLYTSSELSDNELLNFLSNSVYNVYLGGARFNINSSSSMNTSEVYINDFGVKLVDDYSTSIVGNTNFIDMEVTQ